MSKFCNQCGAEVPENSRFCPACGARLTAVSEVEPAQNEPVASMVEPVSEPVTEQACAETGASPAALAENPTTQNGTKHRRKGLLWGICGGAAAVVLAILAFIFFFEHGGDSDLDFSLIPVRQGEKWGYVNQKGEFVINPQFTGAELFNDGLAAVENSDGKCGFINKKGEFVIPYKYKSVTAFNEGYAFVVEETSAPVCVNTKGKEEFKCPDNFSVVTRFHEGLAAFKNSEGKWGYINTHGKVVINAQFTHAGEFSEGLAAICDDHDNRGFIDKKGKIVINPQFKSVMAFHNGMAAFSNGKTWGYIDKEGKYVINPQFDEASAFVGDMAVVKSGKQYGFIDKKGKYTVNPQFDGAFAFSEDGLISVIQGEKWGFVDEKGKIVINPQFEVGAFVEKEFAIVCSADKYGFINRKGEYVCNPQFDAINVFLSEYAESDYYDDSNLLNALFEGWTSAKTGDGISGNTTLGDLRARADGELREYAGRWSMEKKISDDALCEVKVEFNESLYDYDYDYYSYSINKNYKDYLKPSYVSYEIYLDGDAGEHADQILSHIVDRVSSIYGVKLTKKSSGEEESDDEEEKEYLYYNLDNSPGVLVAQRSESHLMIIVSFSSEQNRALLHEILEEPHEEVSVMNEYEVEPVVEDDYIIDNSTEEDGEVTDYFYF